MAVIGLGLAGLYSYREFYQPAEQDYPAERYQPARDPTRPPVAPKQQPTPKVYDPHCDQPQNHDDADLCAQWGAVRAVNETNRLTRVALKLGFIGFWIASLGGLIGVIGTAFLIKTFRENRRSANAAIAQVDMMRESQLPDLVVGNITYLKKGGDGLPEQTTTPVRDGMIQIGLRNRSQTLLYVLPSRHGWVVAPSLPKKPEYSHDIVFESSRDPLPGHPVGFYIDLTLTKGQLAAIRSGRSHLWIWARVEVKDIFGGKHVLGFAAKWIPQGSRPTGDMADVRWGNYFQAVFDPAYHYREHKPA